MADVSRWQQSFENRDIFLDPSRLATNLYKCYLQMFRALVGRMQQDSGPAYLRRLRHQMHRFSLWGANFNAWEGGLDDKLTGAERLKSTLLPLLASMGKALMGMIGQFDHQAELEKLCSQYLRLDAQVSEAMNSNLAEGTSTQRLSSSTMIDQLRSAIDQLGSSDSTISSISEQSEVDELLKDVDTYNTCLFDLGSILQDPAEHVANCLDKSREAFGTLAQAQREEPAKEDIAPLPTSSHLPWTWNTSACTGKGEWLRFNLLSLGIPTLLLFDRPKLIVMTDRWGWHSQLLDPFNSSRAVRLYRCRRGGRGNLPQFSSAVISSRCFPGSSNIRRTSFSGGLRSGSKTP